MSSAVKTVVETAQNAVHYAANTVEPFTPAPVKKVVEYSIKTATPIVDYASKTAKDTVDYASKTVTGTVDYAQKTAKDTVDYGKNVINSSIVFASSQATKSLEFGKVVVNGATTTVHLLTPGPVLTVLNSTMEGASKLSKDPVGTVKPYVPTFIIHIGEKSYEVVGQVSDQTTEGIKAASGFIVTKVNGTTQYVTSVPLIASIIEKLEQITAPIIARFGKKLEDGSVQAQPEIEELKEQ